MTTYNSYQLLCMYVMCVCVCVCVCVWVLVFRKVFTSNWLLLCGMQSAGEAHLLVVTSHTPGYLSNQPRCLKGAHFHSTGLRPGEHSRAPALSGALHSHPSVDWAFGRKTVLTSGLCRSILLSLLCLLFLPYIHEGEGRRLFIYFVLVLALSLCNALAACASFSVAGILNSWPMNPSWTSMNQS